MAFPFLHLFTALALTGAPCPTHAARVDTSVAISRTDTATMGDDFGQTFVAQDSFLTRVVLWEPPDGERYGGPATLVIYDCSATGAPLHYTPDITGPSVPIPPGGGVAKIPLVFNCSPAIRLPHLGWFEVAFRVPCGDRLWFCRTVSGVLPVGNFVWNMVSRCPPLGGPEAYPDDDLLVDIETCDHDPSGNTAAVPATWGRVKAIYH